MVLMFHAGYYEEWEYPYAKMAECWKHVSGSV
jgi:hypothetical protein